MTASLSFSGRIELIKTIMLGTLQYCIGPSLFNIQSQWSKL